MKQMDEQKTKAQMIEELNHLRKELDLLKAKVIRSESADSLNPLPRSPRIELNSDIEFIADFDIVRAKGINISESGICFQIGHDLPFELQFKLVDDLHRYRAKLIWVKRCHEGGYRIGLQFIPPEPFPQF
jgi:hypothetical protein